MRTKILLSIMLAGLLLACFAPAALAAGSGTVKAWGSNAYGQLGDGTITQRKTPVDVSGLTDITAVAGGNYHTVALKSDGTVWAWGYNALGQLGDGTTTDRTAPVQVGGLTGVTAIAAGGDHTVALKYDGTVWAWGGNGSGQLGNGTTDAQLTPVQVSGLTGVVAVAAGYSHTVALKSDGTVWAWGCNGSGQLGDGTTTDSHTPVQVSGLGGVVAIVAGEIHTVALKSDGTVWAWGMNNSGQLGDGTTADRHTPVQVIGPGGSGFLTGVTSIAAGSGHTVAVTPVWMTLTLSQDARNVTLNAKGCRGGAPLSGKKFRIYMSTYDAAYSTWSAWTLVGSPISDANGEATKSFPMYKGKYRFKTAFEPYGAPKVASAVTSDCIIAPVAVLSPAAGTVTPDSTPALSWKAFAGATGYAVQTCSDQYFNTFSEKTVGNVTTVDLLPLTRGVKIFWRVIAILPTGRSMPSAPRDLKYKEGTSLTNLDPAFVSSYQIRPAVVLSGVDSGLPLSDKTVYFYYKKTTATTWQSAGSAVSNVSGVAQLASPKTLTAGDYKLKATFAGDAEFNAATPATGTFTLPAGPS